MAAQRTALRTWSGRARRRAGVAGVLVGVLVLAGCWPIPGGGTGRSGWNPFEDILSAANVSRLAARWVWVSPGPPAAVRSPVTSRGGVHAVVHHRLVTVDQDTGALRWAQDLFDPDPPAPGGAGPLSVDGDDVYAPVSFWRGVGPTGTHRFGVESGEPRGTPAGAPVDAIIPSFGRLAGSWADGSPGGVISGVFVTDTRDPARSWRSVIGVSSNPNDGPSGAVASLDGLVLRSGPAVLAFPWHKPSGCGPLAPGAPWLETCPPRWSANVGAWTRPALSRDGGTVAVGRVGGVVVLDAATGTTRWEGTLPAGAAVNWDTAPVVTGSQVAIGYTLRRSHGVAVWPVGGCGAPACAPTWTGTVPGPVTLQPAAANGVLFVPAGSSLLAFALDGCRKRRCASLWSTDLGALVTGGPAVSVGQVYVGTADGRLVAFGLPR
jgi:hypothetical protein